MKKGFFRVAHSVHLLSVGVPLIRKTRVLEKNRTTIIAVVYFGEMARENDRGCDPVDPTCDQSACGRLRWDSRISDVLGCVTSDFFREGNKKM